MQWRRPEALSNGWTDALSIWVPGDDILEVPGDSEPPDGTQWIEPATAGEAIEFRLRLVEPRRGRLNLGPTLQGEDRPGAAVINGFRLGTGEVLVIFSAVWPLDELRRNSLQTARRMARSHLGPSFDLAPELGPRTTIFETDDVGHPNLWDLSLLAS